MSTTYTHGDSHTVSPGTDAVKFEVSGMQALQDSTLFGDTRGSPGLGGYVEGVIASASPGTTYYFRGAGTGTTSDISFGSTSGDYIDVRQAGTTLSDQILVAAGGGSGNEEVESVDDAHTGGDGGADTGDGGDPNADYGGQGGTQTAGGDAADFGGSAGSREFGGAGEADSGNESYAGSGGGGYYGGGGGGGGGGQSGAGGGGSNFVDGGVLTSTVNQRGGSTLTTPEVVVTEFVTPAGVAVDSLTEPGEAQVRVQASATDGYASDATWTVYRSTDGSQGSTVHTETGDGALDVTLSSQPTGDVVYYTAELSNPAGADTQQQSIKVRLAAVDNISVASVSDTSADIDGDAVTNADEYALYRAESSGTTFADYTEVAISSSLPITDSPIEEGEEFFWRLQARISSDPAFDSRESAEVSAVTPPTPPTIDALDDTAQGEITVTISDTDDSTDGTVELYVSTSSGTLGSKVDEAPAQNTGAYTLVASGLPAETEHWLTARRQTDHANADSTQENQWTKPPAPTGLDVIALDGDDITGSWTDNASNEVAYRRKTSTDGGSTFATVGSDLAPDTTQATWSGLSRPDEHVLKVQAVVGSGDDEATADSNTVTRVLVASTTPTAGAGWTVELEHSSGRTVRPDVVGEPAFKPRLKTLPKIDIPVRRDESWLNQSWDDARMRVWRNGQRLPIDTLISRPTTPGENVLRGRGGSELLRQADKVVDQDEVDNVVRDLVSNKTSYATNVDDPNAATSPDTLLQEATTSAELQNLLLNSLAADTPLRYPPSAGVITPAKTCFFGLNDGGDGDLQGSATEVTDGSLTNENWEDADAMRLDPGDDVYVQFDIEHEIPASAVTMAIRMSQTDSADVEFELDDIPILDGTLTTGNTSVDWYDVPDVNNSYFTLGPGNNPHELRLTNQDSTETIIVDCFNLVDTRYHTVSNFPNQIITDPNGPGYLYLPGPSKFPDDVSFVLQDATPPVSISGAKLVAEMPSGFTPVQLELSPDQGASWPLSATDTETLEGDFASLAAQVRSRISIGGGGTGQSETPVDGYASPEITSIEVFGDLDETPLFVSQNFQGSILDVLQQGADYADAVFEVQWDDAANSQSVEWTQPGQREATAQATISDYETTRTTEERRDRIRVTGRSVPVDNEEFTADHGTAVALNNDQIQPDSETVTDTGGSTQYVQGQDYTIDWETGEITVLSSGNMADSTTFEISYRWNAIGVADRSGASSPFTVRRVELPQLSTDRECEIAARRIRDATDQPLWEAQSDLPPDEIGLTVIEELDIVELPGSDHLEVREIEVTDAGQSVRLGNRPAFDDVVDDIRRKLSQTAQNT